MADDEELLGAWRAGDRTAGSELFSRHLPAVHRFLRGKTSAGVDDLVQRTFLRCVESREDVREAASFRAWLIAIARNELYAQLRRAGHAEDVGTSMLVDLDPSPSHVVAAQHDRDQIVRALRSIPLDLQIALELHYWEGWSAREVATVLDVPHGTIKTRIRRARELLRESLERTGASPAAIRETIERLGEDA